VSVDTTTTVPVLPSSPSSSTVDDMPVDGSIHRLRGVLTIQIPVEVDFGSDDEAEITYEL
jgi:hypothetical protein